MMRKYLLRGLTLVLVVSIVSLVIRGRRLERQRDAQGAEGVQQSESMPTRVLSPQDLEIVNSKIQLDFPRADAHEVEIRNNGNVSYSRMQLRFVFLDRNGRVLATKTNLIARTVMPGKSIKVADMANNEIPPLAVISKVSILYADVSPASAQSR